MVSPQRKNMTINGVLITNYMGIAEVDNIKKSLQWLRLHTILDTSLAPVYGINWGNSSIIFDPPLRNQKQSTRTSRSTKCITTSFFNLNNMGQMIRLPFITPYIGAIEFPPTDLT